MYDLLWLAFSAINCPLVCTLANMTKFGVGRCLIFFSFADAFASIQNDVSKQLEVLRKDSDRDVRKQATPTA